MLADNIELALAALIIPVAGAAQIVTTKTATDKAPPPVIICTATIDGPEDPMGSGNFHVAVDVAIKTDAAPDDDTAVEAKAASQALVEDVFGVIQVSDIAAKITEAGDDVTIFPGSVQFVAAESGRDPSGVWIDGLHFNCYACGKTLT